MSGRPVIFDEFVPGIPAPKGSKTAYARKGAAPVVVEGKTPAQRARLAAWEGGVRRTVHEWLDRNGYDAPPWSRHTPIACEITFYMPEPQRPKDPQFPVGPPDLDKLERALHDSLVQRTRAAIKTAGLLEDDAQIVYSPTWKRYPVGNQGPGARIVVRAITAEERAACS